MKKFFALLLTGILTFGLMACGNTDEPGKKEMPADMASMAAPVDALARCMLEQKLEYDPQDPEFFWTALYYFTGAYGLNHELVTEEEGTYRLMVPTPVMQEHATALFADYDDLFELPDIMEGNVSFSPEEDAYFISRGDIGLSELKFTAYAETNDGHALRAELWSTGPEEEMIAAYDVTLVENAYADGIENPLYLYSVKDIAPFALGKAEEAAAAVETAIFNGLADSHTAELTLPDGSVQAFQFDGDSEVGKVMGSLKEGDGITIGYREEENGALKIVSIE